jgi:hypothetical protein
MSSTHFSEVVRYSPTLGGLDCKRVFSETWGFPDYIRVITRKNKRR